MLKDVAKLEAGAVNGRDIGEFRRTGRRRIWGPVPSQERGRDSNCCSPFPAM
ncbi:hypothetical protein [Lyngbya sp. CCY1209]|uniref:hypothetical protein n=1 Tax=Lyngbya sp. CCY1209 TaxID=2886103 RepID=UPI002D2072DB|nr:hypothetical protein [Lyngbya sp. CCY1209]MEB3882929.1 hypothetical protein [Lyngbya sp. CCY1209]